MDSWSGFSAASLCLQWFYHEDICDCGPNEGSIEEIEKWSWSARLYERWRLQSQLHTLRTRLEGLQNLEETFNTSVQRHLARIAPKDRAYFESMLHPTTTALGPFHSTVEKLWSSVPHVNDGLNTPGHFKSWVAVCRDLVATGQALVNKRRGDIEALYDRLRYFEAKLDLEEQLLEEKRREEMLYMEHLKRLIMYSAALVKKLLEAMLACCNITVLPNRHRPPCRTMPWDILPSLVILWGVCWMFYTPPVTPFLDESCSGIQANDYEVGFPVAQGIWLECLCLRLVN